MFVIESAINKAADALGIPASQIQEKNLLVTGNEFPYGQLAESEANECWNKAVEMYNVFNLRKEINAFNESNKLFKKGISLMPVCFGISFTKTMMNQARALVHVYTDGSIGISTGAVEMGQGVNTKMLQVAAKVFSVEPSRIKIHSTNTFRISNTSSSAASATADLNGKAVEMACTAILGRLKEVAAESFKTEPSAIELKNEMVWVDGKQADLSWNDLVLTEFIKRISLAEHAHYATPDIKYDTTIEKGHPFAYHVYGTAIITVTVDCLRGIYEVDDVKIVHDFGASINPVVDLGQIEGGLVQGIGWMTMEEIIYDKEGRLRSNALSTYKVPDIYSVPKNIDVHFLETQNDNLAIFRSKAVGEPPLMYGIGTFFALRNAIRAFNPNTFPAFSAPMTPEKVLCSLYSKAPEYTKTTNEEAIRNMEFNK